MIAEKTLRKLYLNDQRSMQEIADIFKCSLNQVKYWINKYGIRSRTISAAVYLKNHPTGDPFKFRPPRTMEEAKLYGLGFGLYWGEGTKSNTKSVRLGNTDPDLIKKFIEFLAVIYGVKKNGLRFGLQIFSDMDPKQAVNFWSKHLGVSKQYFQKAVVTPTRGVGTYKNKIKHGVLTVYYNNTKLRGMLGAELAKFGYKENKR